MTTAAEQGGRLTDRIAVASTRRPSPSLNLRTTFQGSPESSMRPCLTSLSHATPHRGPVYDARCKIMTRSSLKRLNRSHRCQAPRGLPRASHPSRCSPTRATPFSLAPPRVEDRQHLTGLRKREDLGGLMPLHARISLGLNDVVLRD
jgi:hypothetical protein